MTLEAFLQPKLPRPLDRHSSPFATTLCTQTLPRPTKRRAPREFVRVRHRKSGAVLETAITTYQSTEKTLHIHSLLHLAEPSYYESLRSPAEIVFYELITHSSNTTPPPRRLKTSIAATPSARAAAKRLAVSAQADVLDLSKAGWYIADVPADRLPRSPKAARVPDRLGLRLLSALLPCPELNLLALDQKGVTPREILQLLKASVQDKRRLLYAWRSEKSSALAVNSATDDATKLRDETAWQCVDGVKGEVALLYGAWHTGRFCRLAEASGMSFVKRKWVTAMKLPAVDVRWWDVGLWGLLASFYCAIAGFDWIVSVEKGLAGDWIDVFSYLIRHWFVYLAVERWFDELG